MAKVTFEQAIVKLEEVVKLLEKGELSLEESIAMYEQGVKLTALCNNEIKNAKLKIDELKIAKE